MKNKKYSLKFIYDIYLVKNKKNLYNKICYFK